MADKTTTPEPTVEQLKADLAFSLATVEQLRETGRSQGWRIAQLAEQVNRVKEIARLVLIPWAMLLGPLSTALLIQLLAACLDKTGQAGLDYEDRELFGELFGDASAAAVTLMSTDSIPDALSELFEEVGESMANLSKQFRKPENSDTFDRA